MSVCLGSNREVAPLRKFVARIVDEPIIVVGAGGSFSATEFVRLCHEARGGVVVTLMNGLERTGAKRGIASMCIGGGEALAMAIELI